MQLDTGVVQADQGSDKNLISNSLVTKLALEKREIPGVKGFMIQTADGNFTTLRTFAVFILSVSGICRMVYAYIRLKPRSVVDAKSLILGLSWLYSVKATINMCENYISTGDPVNKSKDVKRQIVKCAIWKDSLHQKPMLALAPEVILEALKAQALHPHLAIDYSASQESSSYDGEEEDEGDEEDSDENLDLK